MLMLEANPWMKYSSTFRKVYADGFMEGYLKSCPDGREQANRRLLLIFGEWIFGEPDEETLVAVRAASPERIQAWTRALNQSQSWSALIHLPEVSDYMPKVSDAPAGELP